MSIGKDQIKILEYAKNLSQEIDDKKSEIKSHLSSLCYVTTWSDNQGYAHLKFKKKGWSYIFSYIYIFLKNLLSIASHAEYETIKSGETSKKNDNLILTFGFKNFFKTDGSMLDRYFKENTEDVPNTHWIVISMDGFVPYNLKKNISIIRLKKSFFKFRPIAFFKVIIFKILKYKFSIKKIFHYLNFHTHLAENISEEVKKELQGKKYKFFLHPWEGQPFQLASNLEAKKYDKKITTIAYMHTILPPVPSDYINRDGSADYALVHGEATGEILQKKLYWEKNKIIFSESLRFKIDETRNLSNTIFIPADIKDINIYIKEFEKIFKTFHTNKFPILKVKNHPLFLKSLKHISFKENLESIMKKYKNRFSNNPDLKNISIFFGTTAAIFEALELGIDSFHIFADDLYDSHNEDIFPELKVKKIAKNCFKYGLNNKGKYIVFGRKKGILMNILKNLS